MHGKIVSRCVASVVAGLAVCIVAGCATDSTQRRPYLLRENLDNAKRHLEQKDQEEAAQIYQAVLLADTANAEAKAGLAGIPSYDASLMQPSLLGKNLCRRPKRDGIGWWIALYPLNRMLDILDVVSFHVGLEGGALADVHMTHAAQLEAGACGGMQLGWWHGRNLAVGSGNVAGFALGPFNCEGEGFTRVGTRGAATRSYSLVTMSRPTDYVYQRYRDYWGIGARATVLAVGAEVELHPVEFADALCGFFFVDFLRDDLGRTRGLKLNDADLEAVEELLNSLSAEELRRGLRGRAVQAPSSALPPATESVQAKPVAEPPAK